MGIEYISLAVAVASLIISAVSAVAAIKAVNVAKESIRKSMTAQVELYMLDTLKNTLKTAEIEKILVTMDYWCKLIINDCLDKTLTKDNEKFIKSSIETIKNTLKATETKKILVTMDYWCKLIINDCLDKTLTKDNEKFIKSSIEIFKDDINRSRSGYNNIIEYAERKGISL